MQTDDPVTGRQTLTQSAYRDASRIRSRQAIFAYAETPADPRWRTSLVPWDGTQVVADVGCGNGLDLRRLVPEVRCRHAIGLDLSPGMLHTLETLRGTGRLTLVQADAQQLPLRDGSVDVGLAMHMLYHVPDIRAAIRELRRIVRPGGTVLASTNSAGTLSEVHSLLDAAVSGLLGRPVRAMPAVGFTIENGAALLEEAFSDVALHARDTVLAFPAAQPVADYLASVREPIERTVGEPFSFDTALDTVTARVGQVIRDQGRFRTTFRSGVFLCR
jgi:ubiquinone/menaquinone biosynthesis C-methylase UbiE